MRISNLKLLISLSVMALILNGCNGGSTENINNNINSNNKDTPLVNLQDKLSLQNNLKDQTPTIYQNFFYTIDINSNVINTNRIDSQTGMPGKFYESTPTGDSPLAIAQALTKNGLFVYTLNFLSNTISAYSAAADTGHLTPLGELSIDGKSASDIKIYHSSKNSTLNYAYVINSLTNDIDAFFINSDGTLKEFPSALITNALTGKNPVALSIVGDYLYVLNRDDVGGSISIFSIDPITGGLMAISSPIIRISSNDTTSFRTIEKSPDDKYVYVINEDEDDTNGAIYTFAINPDGSLKLQGKPIATGNFPSDMVFYKTSFAYVANKNDNNINIYNNQAGILTNNQYSPVSTNDGYTPNYMQISSTSLYLISSSINDFTGTFTSYNILESMYPGLLIINKQPVSSTSFYVSDMSAITGLAPATKFTAITVDNDNRFIVIGADGVSYILSADLTTYQSNNMNITHNPDGTIPAINDIAYDKVHDTLWAVGNQEILKGTYDKLRNLSWTEESRPPANLMSVTVDENGIMTAGGARLSDNSPYVISYLGNGQVKTLDGIMNYFNHRSTVLPVTQITSCGNNSFWGAIGSKKIYVFGSDQSLSETFNMPCTVNTYTTYPASPCAPNGVTVVGIVACHGPGVTIPETLARWYGWGNGDFHDISPIYEQTIIKIAIGLDPNNPTIASIATTDGPSPIVYEKKLNPQGGNSYPSNINYVNGSYKLSAIAMQNGNNTNNLICAVGTIILCSNDVLDGIKTSLNWYPLSHFLNH